MQSIYITLQIKNLKLLCVTAFLILAVSLSCNSFAQTKQNNLKNTSLNTTSTVVKTKKAKVTTSYFMRGASFKEGPDEAQFVQLLFNPYVELDLSSQFKLTADATLSLNSSRVQTRFTDPSLNTINANEILLSYLPNKNITVSAGAINQKHLNSPALVQSGLAFPGLTGSYAFKYKNLDLKFKAQYTIPNSTSLDSDRTGNEELPTFTTQGFEATWTPRSWFSATANVNYFNYSPLPSIVAFNSVRLGNTGNPNTQAESSFDYDFRGLSQAYDFSFDINKKYKPSLSIKTVDNFDAPSNRERAQSVTLSTEINFKDYSITPLLTFFYAESDASPAIYADPSFGRNNREGEAFGVRINFKKLGFALKTSYVNSDLIRENNPQNDMEFLELQLEVANVSF